MPTTHKQETAERFEAMRKKRPQPGDILQSMDGTPITLVPIIDWQTKKTVLAVRALIDPDVTGWYLTSKRYGLMCFLTEEAQAAVYHAFEGHTRQAVFNLRVVRQSHVGSALFCELTVSSIHG